MGVVEVDNQVSKFWSLLRHFRLHQSFTRAFRRFGYSDKARIFGGAGGSRRRVILPILLSMRISLNVSLSLAFLASLLGQVAAAEVARGLVDDEQVLGGIPCRNQINDTLINWDSLKEWRFAGRNLDGARIFRTPNRTIGVWAELKIFGDKTVELSRITAQSLTRVRWDTPSCKPNVRAEAHPIKPAAKKDAFDDAGLTTLLSSGKKGIIIAWSPHMTLSVGAVREAVQLGKELGIHVEVVRDPHSRTKVAKERLIKEKLPAAYMQKIQSIDLVMRDMLIHYPSILFFKDGQIKGHVFPGYEVKDQLRALLKRELVIK
jgi:hypothetical protein